jgi:hypothetical protein
MDWIFASSIPSRADMNNAAKVAVGVAAFGGVIAALIALAGKAQAAAALVPVTGLGPAPSNAKNVVRGLGRGNMPAIAPGTPVDTLFEVTTHEGQMFTLNVDQYNKARLGCKACRTQYPGDPCLGCGGAPKKPKKGNDVFGSVLKGLVGSILDADA